MCYMCKYVLFRYFLKRKIKLKYSLLCFPHNGLDQWQNHFAISDRQNVKSRREVLIYGLKNLPELFMAVMLSNRARLIIFEDSK